MPNTSLPPSLQKVAWPRMVRNEHVAGIQRGLLLAGETFAGERGERGGTVGNRRRDKVVQQRGAVRTVGAGIGGGVDGRRNSLLVRRIRGISQVRRQRHHEGRVANNRELAAEVLQQSAGRGGIDDDARSRL